MSLRLEHYDGDVGCKPCEFWQSKTNNRQNTHRSLLTAFSLVEMLMALLVASLLLAALAPVMTRRFNDNVNVSGTGNGGRAPAMFKCWDYDDPALQLASDGSGYKVLPEDFKIDDAWIVNFILASGGGGGAGATSSDIVPDSYTEPDEGKNGIKIEHDMDDFEIEMMTGGGGGAGGGAGYTYTLIGPPNATSCKQYGLNKTDTMGYTGKYGSPVVVADGSGLCVTAYNQKTNGCITHESIPLCGPYNNAIAVCNALKGRSGWNSANWRLPSHPEQHRWNYSFLSSPASKGGLNVSNSPDVDTSNWQRRSPHSLWSSTTTYHSSCSGGVSISTWTRNGNATGTGTFCSTKWNSGYTNYGSVRCVLSDNIPGTYFHSLSGGGGSSAPAITSNNFDTGIKEKFIQRIKENIGGYIILKAGKGGNGGNKADNITKKAGDGKDGEDSCILIKNSSNITKYALCVPGGNGGSGANAENKDSNSTDGFGTGGNKIIATNACYAIDYTINSAGVKTTFNCTEGGKSGENGIAGQNNPSAGGKGGASIKNPSVQAANNGNAGVTPNSTANPGAGGGGGSATITESGTSVSYAFGDGGSGGDGYIKLKYKHYYEAAGGGGGGAGYVGHIKNINVGKSATCSIKVGYGGIGGNGGGETTSAMKGENGGESSIVCSNAPNVTYRIFGGNGGNIGTSASTTSGSSSVGGNGGTAGSFDDTGNIFTRLFTQGNFTGYKGLDGKPGGAGEAANYKEGIRSAGGRGGTSGTGEKGKCGGLYNEAGVCSSVNIIDDKNNIEEPNQNSLNGQGFSGGDINIPTKDSIVEANPKFGKAGAGGGGGAWYIGKNPGKGGNGQGGYVCIYWDKLE